MKNYSILALAIMALCTGTTAEARYSGGTGEPNDPYRIATPEDLNDIGNHEDDWDKHFTLINDVNLAQFTGAQFNTIGNYFDDESPNNEPFIGIFDGNDHKIWNFTWASGNISFGGLFRYLGGFGEIKNLGMENVDVNGSWFAGGLMGLNEGEITNCYSGGSVTGSFHVGGLVGCNRGIINNCYSAGTVDGYLYAGGLAGTNENGIITKCYSSTSVTGAQEPFGGLVGYNYGGTITNCYSTGTVVGLLCVGGLVGYNEGQITDCYSIATVSGNTYVGGLVGWSWLGSITNCYSIGNVSGNYSVGGLVGSTHHQVTASFWDTQTSCQSGSTGGTGKTTAEMKAMSTFTDAGWDFVEIWGIGENQTYPFLRIEPAGDLDHDKKVDLLDLAILASHWLEGVE